jgi:MFS family permease
MLVDRYGPHKLLTATCAICALGCYVFASANSIYVAEIGRFLMGFSAAFAFVGAVKLATLWFCPTRLGLLAGLTQALGMFGAAMGEGLVAVMVNHVGWRESMVIIGCVLLALALLIGFIVRDRPNTDVLESQPSDELARHISYWQALLKVFSNPQSWLNGLFIGLLYAPTGVFAELWGVSYVMQNNGLPRTVAARAVSMIFIGWAVGGPLAGMLSDKIRRRVPVMFASAILCLIFLSAILYVQDMPVSILFLLMFLYGLTNTGVGVSYALSGEINPRQVAGTSIAFANMASILIAAALQPIVGSILDANWDGTTVAGVKIYSTSAYHIAMTSLPICLLLSVFACLLVKETYCKITTK